MCAVSIADKIQEAVGDAKARTIPVRYSDVSKDRNVKNNVCSCGSYAIPLSDKDGNLIDKDGDLYDGDAENVLALDIKAFKAGEIEKRKAHNQNWEKRFDGHMQAQRITYDKNTAKALAIGLGAGDAAASASVVSGALIASGAAVGHSAVVVSAFIGPGTTIIAIPAAVVGAAAWGAARLVAKRSCRKFCAVELIDHRWPAKGKKSGTVNWNKIKATVKGALKNKYCACDYKGDSFTVLNYKKIKGEWRKRFGQLCKKGQGKNCDPKKEICVKKKLIC